MLLKRRPYLRGRRRALEGKTHDCASDIRHARGKQPIAGQKTINLALQGGGSHGAFTWGVLDRLLEEERLAFDGITATSAGGVNAVVLADGLALGGREGARELLRKFWKKMSETTSTSIIAPSFFDQMNPNFGLENSPGYVLMDMISRFMSPYQLNPMDANPMRDLLNEEVNFERVRAAKSGQAVSVARPMCAPAR